TVLEKSYIPIHAIIGRAKGVGSLRGKLRKKKYTNPAAQVQDLVGVRVITYFSDDVDRVKQQFSGWVEVSAKGSRDARAELETNKFGYRTLNLVVRLRTEQAVRPEYSTLRRRWFEIQIRSILDHAWSEIEHDVVYKSGIRYPDAVRRGFTAV